ncbi:MAG TPA: putative porin [Verrucomicrobiota bacterium]|nr:putative porin [Verrucomicrobiota bacterium]
MHPTCSSRAWRRAILAALTGALGAPIVHAQSADALLDKLVEKGVLTTDEASELREQSDKDFTKAYQVKSGMPDWVTTFRIGGDFRGRYEGFFSSNDDFNTVNRFRYRLRLAFTAVLLDNFEVGVRLGSGNLDGGIPTGGIDPISQNQTLQNNASKKGIFVDLAYMKWSPINTPVWSGAFTFGKMENPFIFSDMVFDNDYTPEGFAQTFAYRANDQHTLNLMAGQFILDEIGVNSGTIATGLQEADEDPYLFGGQLLLSSTWTPKITTTVGGGYLTIMNKNSLLSSSVPNIGYGNERYTAVVANAPILLAPVSDFETAVANASITYTFEKAPMYAGVFPVMLFGEYMHNFGAASDQDSGYTAGLLFGKASKRGTWEVGYRWMRSQGDAWWEELPDSDFGAFYANALPNPPPPQARSQLAGYFPGPNVQGSIVRVAYAPYDFLVLSAKVYFTTLIEPYFPDTDSHMTRVQVDAAVKF